MLIAYLDALNIIATMGIYPKDFENRASTTVVNNMKKCEPLIGSFVASNTLSEGKQYVEQIIKIIAPDIVDRFDSKLTEEEKRMLVEALRKLMEQNNSNASNYKANETGNEQPNGPIIAILTDNAKEEGDNTGKNRIISSTLEQKRIRAKDPKSSPNQTVTVQVMIMKENQSRNRHRKMDSLERKATRQKKILEMIWVQSRIKAQITDKMMNPV